MVTVGNLRVRLLLYVPTAELILFPSTLVRNGYSFTLKIKSKDKGPFHMRPLFCRGNASSWDLHVNDADAHTSEYLGAGTPPALLNTCGSPPHPQQILSPTPSNSGVSHWPEHFLGSGVPLDFDLFCGHQQLLAPYRVHGSHLLHQTAQCCLPSAVLGPDGEEASIHA